MSRLMSLYPAAWRDRYEEEFLALMRDRPPALTERLDIVRGAIDARLHPQVRRSVDDAPPSPESEDDIRFARRLGIGALIGAALWPIALGIVLMGPVAYDGDGAYRDGSASFPVWFAATALIATGLLGQVIRLPRTAHLTRFSALAAIPAIIIFGVAPWFWPVGLAAVGLTGVLATGGLRAGIWPLWASLTVIGACLAVFGLSAVAVQTIVPGDRMSGGVFLVVIALVLVPVWLCLGATLVRQPDTATPT
jgi:hypothetical protein